MKTMRISLIVLAVGLLFQQCNPAGKPANKVTENETVQPAERWSKEKASRWYEEQGWLVGSNFTPSTAINQLEMWQAETFDTATIDRELGWAAAIGMNTARVYLHDLLWEQDSTGLLQRMDTFLDLADKHDTRVLFVFFDSVWDPFPRLGTQKQPQPHLHNSGWLQSPGLEALRDTAQYPRLERYVKGVTAHFSDDDRVLGWDVWNEPDNTNDRAYGDVELKDKVAYVLPLLEKTFEWVRAAGPSQPVTSGIWLGDWSSHETMTPLQQLQIDQSDVLSFHNYDGPEEFEKRVQWLQRYERPLLCTEYMARPNGSTFQDILPLGKKYNIAMYNWGLVDGKTQTKYPWDSWDKPYTAEPLVWFHEVFRSDGTPYSQEEVDLIRELTGSAD